MTTAPAHLTTTAAAEKARVTTATLRAWCRIGAVQATKTAGRWIIEARSLLRRIQLRTKIAGERRRRAEAKKSGHTDHWDSDHPDIVLLTQAVRAGVAPVAIADRIGHNFLASGSRPMSRRDENAVRHLMAEARRAHAPRRTTHVDRAMDGIGLTSPARPGQCHYCGQAEATCDCY